MSNSDQPQTRIVAYLTVLYLNGNETPDVPYTSRVQAIAECNQALDDPAVSSCVLILLAREGRSIDLVPDATHTHFKVQ